MNVRNNYFFFIFQGTEDFFKKEANLSDVEISENFTAENVLAAYKSEGDPNSYELCYIELRKFVDESLDIYKVNII